MLKVIKAQIDAMQDAIDAFIAQDPTLSQNVKLLRSCKGVGPKSAQAILAMLPEIGASTAVRSPLSSASRPSPGPAAHQSITPA